MRTTKNRSKRSKPLRRSRRVNLNVELRAINSALRTMEERIDALAAGVAMLALAGAAIRAEQVAVAGKKGRDVVDVPDVVRGLVASTNAQSSKGRRR